MSFPSHLNPAVHKLKEFSGTQDASDNYGTARLWELYEWVGRPLKLMGEAVRERGGSVRGFTGAPVVFEGARQQAEERVSSIIEPVILTIRPSSVGTAIIMSEPLPCANFGTPGF